MRWGSISDGFPRLARRASAIALSPAPKAVPSRAESSVGPEPGPFPDVDLRARRLAIGHEGRPTWLEADRMSIIWTIIIGFVAGVVAKFITPGDNEPSGFILTTILGIVGAFVATYLGQAIGWYRVGEGAGLIGAVIGAIIVLLIWAVLARRRSASI
jgi:uncharacterized membrane protein YeaQ/YmgE (transglycosylase-associated protein family)